MKEASYTADPIHGLYQLMMHAKPKYYARMEQCYEHRNPHFRHPFGLDIPRPVAGLGKPEITFVGAGATDISEEVFLAHIRAHAHYTDGCRLTKLRVINMPDQGRGNWVFFEIWSLRNSVISGETNDFSGAGNTARRNLEDVFALLAQTYKLEIERVQLPTDRVISLRNLYAEQQG